MPGRAAIPNRRRESGRNVRSGGLVRRRAPVLQASGSRFGMGRTDARSVDRARDAGARADRAAFSRDRHTEKRPSRGDAGNDAPTRSPSRCLVPRPRGVACSARSTRRGRRDSGVHVSARRRFRRGAAGTHRGRTRSATGVAAVATQPGKGRLTGARTVRDWSSIDHCSWQGPGRVVRGGPPCRSHGGPISAAKCERTRMRVTFLRPIRENQDSGG